MDCIVHRAAKSQTRLSDFHFTSLEMDYTSPSIRSGNVGFPWLSDSLGLWAFPCLWAVSCKILMAKPVVLVHSSANCLVETDQFWHLLSNLRQHFWWPHLDGSSVSPRYNTLLCVCVLTESCLTLRDPRDCSPPGSSVHGIVQARMLEWVAISFSRGSSQPRDWTHISYISCIGRHILYHWATWEANHILLVSH